MKEELIDFSEMPLTFGRCILRNCGRAETCLRRLAMLREEQRGAWLSVLNPAAVAAAETCPFYIDAYHPTCAKGLVYDLSEVPLAKAEAVKRTLVEKFGKVRLWRMRKGLCVIKPKDQKLLSSIFAACDAPAPTYRKKVHPWEID